MPDPASHTHDPLLERLADWRPFRALVVGDFMLDEMLYGDAERLSADAPVPILHIRRTEHRPGGAANLAMDLAALGGTVNAVGVTGDDAEARRLRDALTTAGVDPEGLIADPDRPTTVKRNLIGLAQQRHPQKMFRVDIESRDPLGTDATAALLDAVRRRLPETDVLCLEDYNKGVCAEPVCRGIIEMAREAGVPVLVDPAAIADYTRYRGATAITPNRNEAERATGMKTHEGAAPEHNGLLARALLEALQLEAVVLTLDRHGALLLERAGEPRPVPTIARQVYDVSGAGDMMLAGLAAARANGLDWASAVRFANCAAGLEVEVFGVEPIPLERVHHQLLLEAGGETGKLRTPEQVKLEVAARRSRGERIVFTNGCFDILHSGHVTLLERAAELGDFLVVGLNDDASVARLKGPGRPVTQEKDRARVLAALSPVGAVVLFGEDTPERLLEAVRPDVLVKGGDYTPDQVVGRDFVESYGGRIELIPPVEGRSTTSTIARMRQNNA